MGIFDDLIRAEKENPPLIKRLMRYYPRFLDRSPTSVNYRFLESMIKPIQEFKTQIYLLKRLLSLSRPITIYRVQSQPNIYNINFVVDLPDIQNVNIWREVGNDKYLVHTTGELLPGTDSYTFTYTGYSDEIIPTDKFTIEVMTWGEINLKKGFPENDTPQGDHFDHEEALDIIGEWLGIPRKVYDLTISEEDFPYTVPPYNTNRTEWDHTYRERILTYMDKLVREGFIDSELYRIFEVSPTCEGAWRYCAFQDVNEPQDEKYMEDPEFGYNTIWVHGDHSSIPPNITIPTPETAKLGLMRVSPAGKKLIYELIADIFEETESLIFPEMVDLDSKGGMRKFLVADNVQQDSEITPKLFEFIAATPSLEGTLQPMGDTTLHQKLESDSEGSVLGDGVFDTKITYSLEEGLPFINSILIDDKHEQTNMEFMQDIAETPFSWVQQILSSDVGVNNINNKILNQYLDSSTESPLTNTPILDSNLSILTDHSPIGTPFVDTRFGIEEASPQPMAGFLNDVVTGEYLGYIKLVDTQSEWQTLTAGGNASFPTDGTFTITINSPVFGGYKDPASVITDGQGDVSWVNPSYACVQDGSGARADLTTTKRVSDRLVATNFSLGVPSNARVLGIYARTVKKQSGTIDVHDNAVRLYYNGNYSPQSKAKPDWWSNNYAVDYYGGQADLWGWTSDYLTPSVVNSTSFGFYISAYNGSSYAPSAYVDNMKLEVVYRTPSSGYVEYTYTCDAGIDLGTVTLKNCVVYTGTTVSILLYRDIGGGNWSYVDGTTFTATQNETRDISYSFGICGTTGTYKVRVTINDQNTGAAVAIDKLEHRRWMQYNF